MGTFPRRIFVPLAAGATAALLLTGCGSSTSGTNAPNPPAATGTAAGTKVTATETEYKIALSTSTFKAGVYTFDVRNGGTMPHDLVIQGPGVDKQASPIVQPGNAGQVTVDLQKGTYELSCSVDGHKNLGMDLTIQVG